MKGKLYGIYTQRDYSDVVLHCLVMATSHAKAVKKAKQHGITDIVDCYVFDSNKAKIADTKFFKQER